MILDTIEPMMLAQQHHGSQMPEVLLPAKIDGLILSPDYGVSHLDSTSLARAEYLSLF